MQEQDLEREKRELLENLAEPSEKTFDNTLWGNQDRGEPSFKSFEEIAEENEELTQEIFGERATLESLLYRVEGYVLGEAPNSKTEMKHFASWKPAAYTASSASSVPVRKSPALKTLLTQ